ncbi:hypothetical protein PoB_007509900 [Plakobranchus ocellatus]|uniref:Uncharacterized protein n=1 Tax=Plakobranchus ocellatus TaxID=259542 RepID=A0AAV4DWM5_9GAST|nr:hypothetical protein PoB_007509900 [Plakobranchus ocellatus]
MAICKDTYDSHPSGQCYAMTGQRSTALSPWYSGHLSVSIGQGVGGGVRTHGRRASQGGFFIHCATNAYRTTVQDYHQPAPVGLMFTVKRCRPGQVISATVDHQVHQITVSIFSLGYDAGEFWKHEPTLGPVLNQLTSKVE